VSRPLRTARQAKNSRAAACRAGDAEMGLKAPDELRHEGEQGPLWRESWYYNCSDQKNEIGAWLYLWVVPNQPLKSGMLVCFYHGIAADFNSTEAAWKSPNHLLKGPNGSWTYCFKRDVPER